MRKVIFNTYNERGERRNINGNRSTQIEDNAIEYNMRFKYPELLKGMSDSEVVNAYDLFYADEEYFGNNDERFEEWLRDVYPHLDRSDI